jgi:TatD DNase family protein
MITRENARQARAAALAIPLDRIILETDAPSIGLKGILPEQTEPGHIKNIAGVLAELRGLSLEKITEQTYQNTRTLFGPL